MKVNFNNGQVQSNNSGGYWDAEVVVAEIPKGDFAKYVVSKCAKGGKERDKECRRFRVLSMY